MITGRVDNGTDDARGRRHFSDPVVVRIGNVDIPRGIRPYPEGTVELRRRGEAPVSRRDRRLPDVLTTVLMKPAETLRMRLLSVSAI